MHSDLSSARRRLVGLLAAVATAAALLLAGCSDSQPETPAISGESPGEVTIPSLPTTTVPTPTTVATGGGGATTTTTTAAP